MEQAAGRTLMETGARQPADGTAGTGRDLNKYLSVTVRGEAYGVQVLRVREIIEYAPETALPMMPDYVLGAINLRGAGVPVVDLSRRLGGGASTVGRRSCIVIVESDLGGGGFDVGFLVDAVNEVVDIQAAEIEPTPTFGGRLRNDFLRGMGKVKGHFVKLLEVDRLLDPAAAAAMAGCEVETKL